MRFSHIDQDLHIKCAVKKNIRLNQQKLLLVLLRGARVEAGLTQSKLATRLGTDQTFISKYESGERRLDILELREVCQVIGLDFVAFIRRLDKDLNSEWSWNQRSLFLVNGNAQINKADLQEFDWNSLVRERLNLDTIYKSMFHTWDGRVNHISRRYERASK